MGPQANETGYLKVEYEPARYTDTTRWGEFLGEVALGTRRHGPDTVTSLDKIYGIYEPAIGAGYVIATNEIYLRQPHAPDLSPDYRGLLNHSGVSDEEIIALCALINTFQ
jgi:hypothetical protein